MAKHPKKRTRQPRVAVSRLASLKGALTVAGDIRSNIEFQNDVNAILAAVSRLSATTTARQITGLPDGELEFQAMVQRPTPTPVGRRRRPTPP